MLVNLELTHVRIGPRFSIVASEFWWFMAVLGGGARRGLDEQLISGIDGVHHVWPGIGAGELAIDTCANRSSFLHYCCILLLFLFAVFCVLKAQGTMEEKSNK